MENKLTLKAARVNANLTQQELAKQVGVSKDTVGKWERGLTFPNIQKIPLLEKAFNLKYESIIFLSNNDALNVK